MAQKSIKLTLAAWAGLVGVGTAEAAEIQEGSYLCTVEQRAGIGATHLEGAGPPGAFVDEEPLARFMISIEGVNGEISQR